MLFLAKKVRKVSYKVIGAFGNLAIGDICKAILIAEDSDTGIALLYHPSDADAIGSFEFAKFDGKHYYSINENVYVNFDDDGNFICE